MSILNHKRARTSDTLPENCLKEGKIHNMDISINLNSHSNDLTLGRNV